MATTEAPIVHLKRGYRVDGRWQVMRKLGQGGYGAVYKVLDSEGKICGPKACKVENRLSTYPVLKMEVAVLRAMQGNSHTCKLYACGKNDKHIFMTITMLGPSIASLRRHRTFSEPTAMMIAIQCLQALKELHSVGWIHRDVKESNFAIGQHDAAAKRTVFIFDFGFSRCLYNADKTFRRPISGVSGFRGTYCYCSINIHKRKQFGRHDDLISLMYMIVEMLSGALPWFAVTQYSAAVSTSVEEKMMIQKEKCAETLYDGLPDCFVDLHQHLHSLLYEDTPPYDSFENAIYTVFPKSKMNDQPFDWEITSDTTYTRTHERTGEYEMCPTQSATVEIAALSDKPHDDEEVKVNDNVEHVPDEPIASSTTQ